MATEWYIAMDGCQKGPFSTSELQRWIREKKVPKDALVKEGQNGAWMTISDLRLASKTSGRQLLLNLVGMAALLAIGIEVFLFMWAHAPTAPYAPYGLAAYLVAILYYWPHWFGKAPGSSPTS